MNEFEWTYDVVCDYIRLTKETCELNLRVMIAKDSKYYDCGTKGNPINTYGTIIQIDSDLLPIVVRWDDGTQNTYNYKDLVTNE